MENLILLFGTKEGKVALDKAVEDALYFTYQKSPDSRVARAVIQGIHNAPFLTTSLVPFPRFIANAMRFTYEYHRLCICYRVQDVLSQRMQITTKNFQRLLWELDYWRSAYAFRNSKYAGENWYEGKLPNGKT